MSGQTIAIDIRTLWTLATLVADMRGCGPDDVPAGAVLGWADGIEAAILASPKVTPPSLDLQNQFTGKPTA